MRKGKLYLWLDPTDCVPPHSLDLAPGSRDTRKVEQLTEQFLEQGFDTNYPTLVGYPNGEGKVQLLSGTHRHEAAMRAKIKLPVTIWLSSYVRMFWGTEKWKDLLEDIPVKDLEFAELKEELQPICPDEFVDLEY